MSGPCVLSVLSLCALSLWVELGGGAVTLSPAPLPQGSGREPQGFPAVPRILRRRRSWVWNQFFILEESTGDEPVYIGKLHSDRDRGDGQVKYFLSGEGATSIFTINENTGDIHAAKRLDREQQAYYTLRAQVRDRNTNLLVEPESQFLIKVQDINDNAPRFMDGPYLARVAERSPVGTSVMTVAATDADDPTYGNSARLVYSMLQGQPYFSVESKTGVVRTALPDLDRETRDRYLLVIQAKDMMGQMGGLSATTSVTVMLTDVNDNPPQFTRKSYQFIVPESVLLSSVVATIKAVDQDEGPNAEVDYRILDGDGLGTFRIFTNPSTQEGLVTLHKMLDFETKSSYTLHIEAFNRHVDTRFLLAGPFTDVTTVQLLVQNVDEPPVFSPSVSRMVVSEGAPVGHYVGSVSAHDPDVLSSPIRYSIEQMSDAGRYFDIHSLSGVIRVIRRLDRESCALHNLTVVATESLDQLQVGRAVVEISVTDVNDNAPSFPIQYQTSVCERAQPGQLIATVSATDPDEPEHGHHFLFSLPAHTAINHSLLLRDNSDNTASVLAAGVLRRDRLLLLPVVVSDGGRPPLSSTSTLTVSVCQCDPRGTRLRCPPGTPLHPAEPLLGVLALLAVVVVTAVIRRRREEPVMMDEERDIRENIVRYDDEGGGEEDTTSFNMSALRHQTPLLPTGPQTPLLPTGPQTPLLPTGPQTPLLQAGPQTPLLQAGPQTPLLPTGPQTLLLQAGPQTPLLQAGPQTPLLPTGPQTPLLPTGPQTPLLPTGPQTPLLPTGHQTPLLPAGPQTPLLPTYAFEECSSAAESFSPPESPESPDSPDSPESPDSPDYPDSPESPDPPDPLDPPHSGPSYTFLWEWGSRFSRLAELYGRHDGGGRLLISCPSGGDQSEFSPLPGHWYLDQSEFCPLPGHWYLDQSEFSPLPGHWYLDQSELSPLPGHCYPDQSEFSPLPGHWYLDLFEFSHLAGY
ncbi:cadherin-7-like [Menidia menidia]